VAAAAAAVAAIIFLTILRGWGADVVAQSDGENNLKE
jgi:hypothetical protein